MNRLLADDLVRNPGPSLGANRINLMPEALSEVETELMDSLMLNGKMGSYDEVEGDLFDCLGIGLSGPLRDFFRGVGQAVFNVGRGCRNLVRGVFQKPPLPTFNLRTGEMRVALDKSTNVDIGKDGIRVGGSLIAPASEVQTAYDQGYNDAQGGAAGAGPTFTVPGLGAVPIMPVAIAGGAGLVLALSLRK